MRNRSIWLGVLLMLAWAGMASLRANAAENPSVLAYQTFTPLDA